jgi:hypothetical protein
MIQSPVRACSGTASGHSQWQRNCPQSKCRGAAAGLGEERPRHRPGALGPGWAGPARPLSEPAARRWLLCAKSRRHLQVSLGRLRLATTTPPQATAATEAEGPRHRPRSKLARIRRAAGSHAHWPSFKGTSRMMGGRSSGHLGEGRSRGQSLASIAERGFCIDRRLPHAARELSWLQVRWPRIHG